jgi:hypothetical protein
MKSLRLLSIKDLEPSVIDLIRSGVSRESIEWHKAYYLEHGEFIGEFLLEVGGPRCERLGVDAHLLNGNNRFWAAKELELDTVEVKVLNLKKG